MNGNVVNQNGNGLEMIEARPPALSSHPVLDQSLVGSKSGDESILRRYWRIMLKRRLIILSVIGVALIIGVATAILTQRQYSATVTMEIAREADKVVNLDDARASRGQDQEFYQTQYTLLTSKSLAQAVVREMRLADDAAFLSGYKGSPPPLGGTRATREESATGIVLANTEVIPVRLSSIVNVRYSSGNPEMAAKIANSIARNFIQTNLARRFDATSYARTFLQTRIEQIRQKLEDSERQLATYASQQGIINLGNPTDSSSDSQGTPREGQSLASADLTSLNAALADARAKRIQAQSRFEEAQRSGGRSLAEVASNATINVLRQQRAALQGEYQKQSANYGNDYPSQQALRQQIQELDKQIADETTRVSSTVGAAYREALATERGLSEQVTGLKGNVIDLRRRSIQYNIFQRDVDTNRVLYNALLQRYKEIGVAGGVGTNNVSIVDPASVPGTPFKPDYRLNILLSLLIGVVLGTVLALILEQLSESAVTPEDFQKKLGVPLLGTIPLLEKDMRIRAVMEDRKAPVSEAYFSVVTGLRFVTNHGMPRTLFITSTQPSEGKSTTALALAASIAKVGQRVLLIDGDMRNPSIHKTFNVENGAGLSNVLVEEVSLASVVHQSDVPTLCYVTAGHIPPNPAELLTGSGLDAIFKTALAQFDHVVVDGPPIVGLADAPLIASTMEATVFILETGRTRTTQAQQALGRLAAVRAPVVGAVLTKFDVRREGYGYGYGYEYSYGTK